MPEKKHTTGGKKVTGLSLVGIEGLISGPTKGQARSMGVRFLVHPDPNGNRAARRRAKKLKREEE